MLHPIAGDAMINNPYFKYFLLVISAVMFIFSGFIITDLPGDLSKNPESDNNSIKITTSELDLINNALENKSHNDFFTYVGQFESPFRKRTDLVQNHAAVNSPLLKREKLYLKGILIKNKPLAILENEQGETFIRGIGDTVLDQEILKIKETSITLRDRQGTYDLAVQEQ